MLQLNSTYILTIVEKRRVFVKHDSNVLATFETKSKYSFKDFALCRSFQIYPYNIPSKRNV